MTMWLKDVSEGTVLVLLAVTLTLWRVTPTLSRTRLNRLPMLLMLLRLELSTIRYAGPRLKTVESVGTVLAVVSTFSPRRLVSHRMLVCLTSSMVVTVTKIVYIMSSFT